MPVFDFSTVKELEAVPADTYRCTIADATREKPGPGSRTGAEYYKVKFTVTDEDNEYNGRSFYRNYSLSPNSLWALKQFFITAGIDPDDLAKEVDTDELMLEVKGEEVDVTVSVREYSSGRDADDMKLVNQVDKVRAPGL